MSSKGSLVRTLLFWAGLDSTTLREVAISKQLRHPNIRRILDVNYEPTKLEVAFEYVTTVN